MILYLVGYHGYHSADKSFVMNWMSINKFRDLRGGADEVSGLVTGIVIFYYIIIDELDKLRVGKAMKTCGNVKNGLVNVEVCETLTEINVICENFT